MRRLLTPQALKEAVMADVLFALVSIASFVLLIAFVYACDRL
jgi:hypothetical protein